MSILHALILGIIQGVGEFLPISSSGHLVVIPYIFNWNYQGLDFDVALHAGTVLAIIAFFWRDWIRIISSGISHSSNERAIASDSNETTRLARGEPRRIEQYSPNLFWIILVASIPAAIAGYFLGNLAENALRNPLLVAAMLIIFGLILWLADAASKQSDDIKQVSYLKGFLIGIAQAVSLFPGVSRSGITTTAGLFFNLKRDSAMKFSFLLATPAIVGAFILTLSKFQASMVNISFLLAIITSATLGFLSIRFLLHYLQNHSFLPFIIYRITLGVLIIILYFTR